MAWSWERVGFKLLLDGGLQRGRPRPRLLALLQVLGRGEASARRPAGGRAPAVPGAAAARGPPPGWADRPRPVGFRCSAGAGAPHSLCGERRRAQPGGARPQPGLQLGEEGRLPATPDYHPLLPGRSAVEEGAEHRDLRARGMRGISVQQLGHTRMMRICTVPHLPLQPRRNHSTFPPNTHRTVRRARVGLPAAPARR